MRPQRVRILVAPLVFRLPRLRRYHGYALWRTILLRDVPTTGASDDLVTHELCHLWQGQQRRWHMLWTYATTRYRENPYEREARWAVARTSAATVEPSAEGRPATSSRPHSPEQDEAPTSHV